MGGARVGLHGVGGCNRTVRAMWTKHKSRFAPARVVCGAPPCGPASPRMTVPSSGQKEATSRPHADVRGGTAGAATADAKRGRALIVTPSSGRHEVQVLATGERPGTTTGRWAAGGGGAGQNQSRSTLACASRLSACVGTWRGVCTATASPAGCARMTITVH